MPSLLSRALRRPAATQPEEARFGFDAYASLLQSMTYAGNRYLLGAGSSYGPQEAVRVDGEGAAYCSNGVVAAVVGRRIDLFSQARFCWKRFGAGPKAMAADIFTNADLLPLDDCVDLLTWMEFDAATAGNSFVVRDGDVLRRLPPQWVSIAVTSNSDPEHPELAWDATVAGYLFAPPAGQPEVFEAGEVAHYAPKPDPDARFRGMSYLRPVLRQAANQNAYAAFLSSYWRNSATPNMVIKFPPEVQRQTIEVFRDLFLEKHQGADKAFRTAFLGGGADPQVVGANLADLASKEVSAYEFSQICAAAGVPPVVVTIVPGLESASTYANYQTSMRAFADLTVRPLWARAAIKLRPLMQPTPRNAELWYDVSGVAALQADAQDDATVMATNAQTIRALADGGWEKDSVVRAVTSGDLTKLVDTGLLSVQLLPADQSALPPAGDDDGADDEPPALAAVNS